MYRAERDTTPLEVGVTSRFGADPPTIDILDGDEGELGLFPTIVGMKAEQPFILAIFGEKSSLPGGNASRSPLSLRAIFTSKAASRAPPTFTTSPNAPMRTAATWWWRASPIAILPVTKWRCRSPANCRR